MFGGYRSEESAGLRRSRRLRHNRRLQNLRADRFDPLLIKPITILLAEPLSGATHRSSLPSHLQRIPVHSRRLMLALFASGKRPYIKALRNFLSYQDANIFVLTQQPKQGLVRQVLRLENPALLERFSD